jgi:hypothetical protein
VSLRKERTQTGAKQEEKQTETKVNTKEGKANKGDIDKQRQRPKANRIDE